MSTSTRAGGATSSRLSSRKPFKTITCCKVWQLFTDVHQAIGTGIPQAPKGVPLQFFPGCLRHRDVVVLEPTLPGMAVNVGPVVASVGLAFMNQDSMQVVRDLEDRKVSQLPHPGLFSTGGAMGSQNGDIPSCCVCKNSPFKPSRLDSDISFLRAQLEAGKQ